MTKKHTMKSDNGKLGESFQTVGAGHVWEGQELEVKSDPLMDDGTGSKVIIRMFQFAANPEILKKLKPSKQELFNSHAMQIKSMLWADGLVPRDDISPTVNTSKKREMYRIFVTCEPRLGVSVLETPKTLQELNFNQNATN